MDCVAIGGGSCQGLLLEVIGTNNGIYMNTRVKQEVTTECTYRIDACPEAEQDQKSSSEEYESLVLDEVVSLLLPYNNCRSSYSQRRLAGRRNRGARSGVKPI